MTKHLLPLLCGFLLAIPAHAAPRYFQGTLVIEETNDHGHCKQMAGNTKDVQISWDETRKDGDSKISGWIVYGGGTPGKLEGASPAQLTVTSNYYDRSLNTPISLALEIADGKASGILRETPAKLSFEQNICYWQKAKLTLTEKTAETDVAKRMREHAAWYKAYAFESRSNYDVRYGNYADAAAAIDLAIAEVEGILPETHAYYSDLHLEAVKLNVKIDNFELASQHFQRVLDIGLRQSKLGADDPTFYRARIQLASLLYLAGHADKAIAAVEHAALLEDKAKGVDLDDRLKRHSLQSNIYVVAKMYDKAQAIIRDEINIATAEAGSDDARTFEARARLALVLKRMNDNARFEAAFEPLVKEITARFGESHKLARDSNEILGKHYYHNNEISKARPWLESAFRGHRAMFDSATQTVRKNKDATSVLATLLDIYIRQGIVAKDFLEQVKAGTASLDDLPYRTQSLVGLGQAEIKLNQAELDKVLKR